VFFCPATGLGQKPSPSLVAGGDRCSPETGRHGGWAMASAMGLIRDNKTCSRRRQLFSKAAIAAASDANPSFGSVNRGGSVEKRQLQPVDFQKASASNPLQVAVQPDRRLDYTTYLFFTLCPQPHHCFAFTVEPRPSLRQPPSTVMTQ
jgi:hypothetical protein